MTMGKTRQWRVDVIHVNGYHAPHILIETESDRLCKAEAEALKLAKQRTRLSGFPNVWRFEAIHLDRRLLRGKWYSDNEYLFKTGR